MIISCKIKSLAKVVIPEKTGIQIFLIFVFVLTLVDTSSALMVKSKGFGTIFEDDVASARDDAIMDAKITAIQTSLGVEIFSKVEVADGLLLYDKIERVVNGYVSNYTIIDEKRRDNIYEVSIMANIVKQEIGEHRKNSAFPILLFLKVENEIESSESLIPLVGNAFREVGFNAISRENGEPNNFVALFNVVILNENEFKIHEGKTFYGLQVIYELTIKNQISKSVICYFNEKTKGFGETKISALKNSFINSKNIIEKAFLEITGDGISKKMFIKIEGKNELIMRNIFQNIDRRRWVLSKNLIELKEASIIFSIEYRGGDLSLFRALSREFNLRIKKMTPFLMILAIEEI